MFWQLQGDNKVAMASEHPLKHYMVSSLAMDDACQLTLSTVIGTKHLKALAIQKDSPYRNIFNYCGMLIRLRESGILQLGLQKSMVTLTSCGSGPGYSSAGIGHVMSALGILGSGIAASIFLLIIELAWHYHRTTRQQRQSQQN
ncbi:hypothetical protein C0J52_22471 [Blattella germanica]|nr:hypothetical protein C0J52_22471 [Blattella germanica]